MKLQIIPDINIDNTKVLGMIENIHFYRPLLQRIQRMKGSITIEKQYYFAYEILISKDNVSFYLIFDDKLKDNIETELNICWKNATYKPTKDVFCFQYIRELELAEHYFLSLKTDLRGEYPLSNIIETQTILRNDEKILIRLELHPVSYTWYREVEECIKDFEKGKMTLKSTLTPKEIGFKLAEAALDVLYFAMDFVNDLITDIPLQHEKITNSKYSKLFRTGLSKDTKTKSKYNGYLTRIIVSTNSIRKEMLFRNIEKAFNSMAGDNKFIMVDKSNYDNILCSKEIAQIMQMPTKHYQTIYKINNIDNREVDIPKELQGGVIPVGTAEQKGKTISVSWPQDKNICALPKIIIGPQNAGKSSYTENFVVGTHKAGDANIVLDYIQDCELSKSIEKYIPANDIKIIDISDQTKLFALAYTEASKQITEESSAWDRLRIANLLSSQVEYLINSITDETTGELTAPMLRYLYAAAMVVFIHPSKTIDAVFQTLRKWQVRNEYIRQAKYSGCFRDDDEIFYDLDELHERDKNGKIIGTRESLIIGILNRITALNKNIYVKAMLKAAPNNDIDFIKYIEEGKTVLVRIPQTVFPDVKIRDTLTTYFMSRIWLAVQLRKQKDNRLCHVIIDEVHQIPTCANFIKNHITEFRRHRLGTLFTVHYLKQFRSLMDAVKSVGTSYMLLAGTEKENLKALEEELKPFTIEEGLNLKSFYSLNIINYGNQYAKFISKLPPPIK
ncbi:hypothetical protein [Fonticella tunisiensis]|uniref:Uncharacterized protein n=1 Tax=Fonticella tunisiensis TaxID=1096341 RepID=A0A4R7KX02_9CLOT|nr:hypothetical protein [Fonticella tunisiensis]TDT63446.1 hypothetical protein EDD71_102208 [Fonticella tunisiensis]